MVLLCGAYVFGCAFRSILPRADVQRIVLFDTWLSSVMVGRTVATVAEICFVIQWAIVLRLLANHARSDTGAEYRAGHRAADRRRRDLLMVRGDHHELPRQHARELDLDRHVPAHRGGAGPAAVQLPRPAARRDRGRDPGRWPATWPSWSTIDVPMYFERWQADLASGKPLFGLFAGLHDVEHALVRHPRLRAVERRDRLDVALFQRRGVVEPGAVQHSD